MWQGFIPGWRTKIPPASEQLSPRAANTEPVHSGATHDRQLESLGATTKTPHDPTKIMHATTMG